MFNDPTLLEDIFRVSNRIAMFAWVILIFLPRRWPALNLVPALAVPVLLSLAYGAIIMVVFFQGEGGFTSLSNVRLLMSADSALLAGWLHHLAFDLFIASIIAEKADDIGLSRVIQAPILLLTFLAGPLGFFLFQFTSGSWQIATHKRSAA